MNGTGTTTQQIRGAKPNAVFVWVNGQLEYPKRLAHQLGREDVRIVGPSFLTSGRDRWAGSRFSEVILDHGVQYSRELFDGWREANDYARVRDGA